MDYAKKTSPFSYSCGMTIDTGGLQGIDEGFYANSIQKQHVDNGRLIALRLQNQRDPERIVWLCGRSENMKIGGKCLL